MGFLDKIIDFVKYDDSDYLEYDLYNNDETKDYSIIEEINNLKNNTNDNEISGYYSNLTDDEKNNCIKLFNIACELTDIEAATIILALCQTHTSIVLKAVTNEFNKIKKSIDDIKNILG